MVGAMEDRTYIKIFRKMLGWGWYGDTNTFRVFMHILLNANYKESEFRGHKIPAGACVFGRKAWAKELGLSERQIRTALEHLKSTNEVTTKATNKFTIIHVENWGFWQIEEGKATTKTTNKKSNERPTTDQQPTTSKESKKVRNTTTPTIEEVRAYVSENNLNIDADYFYKYYETAEWKDVKGHPVKNWKLKALNWSRREDKANDDRGSNKERKGVRGSAGTGDRSVGTGKVPSWYKPLTSATALVEDAGSKDDA